MKKILLATLLGAAAFSAQAQVGVSINVGQPGFFGSINIGNAPAPQLYSPQPVIIAPAPGPVLEPLYLHVPEEHRRDWRRYCGAYNACGRQVFFVHDDWYNRVYVPHYQAHREEYRQYEHHDEGRHEGWDHDHHDEGRHEGRDHDEGRHEGHDHDDHHDHRDHDER
ncbi:MAG: hypothetical protein JO269_03485 [Burkholderiaceae bacterium]|nr:hypothetical protein [Burkholderiaceae bacterium]